MMIQRPIQAERSAALQIIQPMTHLSLEKRIIKNLSPNFKTLWKTPEMEGHPDTKILILWMEATALYP